MLQNIALGLLTSGVAVEGNTEMREYPIWDAQYKLLQVASP
jgi:hypothetical protein